MKTYSEMNEQIIRILRQSDNPATLYAAARIEELEQELHHTQAERDTLQALVPLYCAVDDYLHEPGTFVYPAGYCNPDRLETLRVIFLEMSVDTMRQELEQAQVESAESLEMAAAQIERLKNNLVHCNAECEAAMARMVALEHVLEAERQKLETATLAVHVHEKSLDEYAQTVHRLQQELEAERKLRREAEEALGIATSALEWHATGDPAGQAVEALEAIDLLPMETLKRIGEIEQRMKKGRGKRE